MPSGRGHAVELLSLEGLLQEIEQFGYPRYGQIRRYTVIAVMGPSYWEVWDKVPFGFTSWTHRPLGVMTLELGYRSSVPWNETRYANPAFDRALDLAAATLDVTERRSTWP